MAEDKPTPGVKKPEKPTKASKGAKIGAAKKQLKTKRRATGVRAADAAVDPDNDTFVLLEMRDRFYKDRVFQMLLITIMTSVVFSLYLFILYYRFTHRPKPIYFESQKLEFVTDDSEGEKVRHYRLLKPAPLTDPQIETSELFIWLNQGLSDIFSFNFQNTESHLQRVKSYFTEDGWKEFEKAMVDAGLIRQVVRGRYIVNARALAPPLLQRRGTYQERFEWHVGVELYVRYRSSLADNRQRWKINVITVRTPVTEKHSRGVAIDYFKVESVRPSI